MAIRRTGRTVRAAAREFTARVSQRATILAVNNRTARSRSGGVKIPAGRKIPTHRQWAFDEWFAAKRVESSIQDLLAGQSETNIMALETRILDSSDQAVSIANVAPGVFDNAIDPRLVSEFLSDPRHHLAVALDPVIGFVSGVHYVHPDKPPSCGSMKSAWPPVIKAGAWQSRVTSIAGTRKTPGLRTSLGSHRPCEYCCDQAVRICGRQAEPVPSVMFTFTLGPTHDPPPTDTRLVHLESSDD